MGKLDALDSALWADSLAGDGEAFGVLFDRHRHRVFRHAFRMLQDAEDAQDVSAIAFLELWRRRASVRLVEGSVLPWLLVTTSNTALNVRRSKARHRRLLAKLPRPESTADPADVYLDDGGLDSVDGDLAIALRSLHPSDLRLIVLVVLEGYSLATAADALDLTIGAAKTRLHRARQRLRTALTSNHVPVQLQSTKGGRP